MRIPFERPNASLSAELQEVAEAAGNLAEFLRRDNSIPDTFPKEQLSAIANVLCQVGEGTAAAAFEVLRYCSHRMFSIRREYIRQESTRDVTGEPDQVPIRGMTLDRHLKDVIASIGTALDECRRQSGTEIADNEEDGVRIENIVSQPLAQALLKQTGVIGSMATEVNGELQRARRDESKRADTLSRSLKDVRGLNALVAAELRMKSAVLSWLDNLGKHISQYPSLLKKLGSSLEIGADIAKPAWSRWSNVWHKIGEVIIDEIKGMGRDLRGLVEKWERQAKTAATKASDDEATVQLGSNGSSPVVGDERDHDIRRRVLIGMARRSNSNVKLRQSALDDLVSEHSNHEETLRLLAERAREDPNQGVRRYCINAFRFIDLPKERRAAIRSTLIDIYRHEKVSAIAELVLKRIANELADVAPKVECQRFFIDVLTMNGQPKHKLVVLDALKNHFSGEPDTLRAVLDAAKNDPNTDVRCHALLGLTPEYAIGAHPQNIVFDIFRRDPISSVKYSALKTIGRNWDSWPDSEGFLRSALKGTNDRRLRNEIRRLLGKSDDEDDETGDE